MLNNMSKALGLLALMLHSVNGIAVPVDAATVPGLPAGYKMVEATGMIEVWPGKPLVQLNGTVQELEKQAKALNPDWKPHPIDNSTVAAQTPVPRTKGRAVPQFKRDSTLCGYPWISVDMGYLQTAINRLRGMGGLPYAAGGYGICSMVACEQSAAIVWCNNNPQGKWLSGYNRIADGATVVKNDCQYAVYLNDWSTLWRGAGQRFDADNVNFIVTSMNC